MPSITELLSKRKEEVQSEIGSLTVKLTSLQAELSQIEIAEQAINKVLEAQPPKASAADAPRDPRVKERLQEIAQTALNSDKTPNPGQFSQGPGRRAAIGPEGRSIQQMVLEVLSEPENEQGVRAAELRSKIKDRFAIEVLQESLAPRLTQMNRKDVVLHVGEIWKLPPRKRRGQKRA